MAAPLGATFAAGAWYFFKRRPARYQDMDAGLYLRPTPPVTDMDLEMVSRQHESHDEELPFHAKFTRQATISIVQMMFKFGIQTMGNFHIVGKVEELRSCISDRPKKQALITVSNHQTPIDDPGEQLI